jgi:hypothetical protein
MGGEDARGQLSAAAPTRDGWLYVSGALTPYDLENLCDQIARLGRRDGGDVHVEVELGGMMKDSPELLTLARRMKRLRRQGVVVHVHAARDRGPSNGSSAISQGGSLPLHSTRRSRAELIPRGYSYFGPVRSGASRPILRWPSAAEVNSATSLALGRALRARNS